MLSDYSRIKVQATMELWNLPRDYAEPVYHYLVYGWDPGSFFSNVLANDFFGAMQHSHPSNQVDSLKNLVSWMKTSMPLQTYGSHEKVQTWIGIDDSTRRTILEAAGLIYTEKEETWLALQGKPVIEPLLW